MNDKKIKNALMESLINIKGLTKKESKEIINSLEFNNELLEKKFSNISNKELKVFYEKISKIIV